MESSRGCIALHFLDGGEFKWLNRSRLPGRRRVQYGCIALHVFGGGVGTCSAECTGQRLNGGRVFGWTTRDATNAPCQVDRGYILYPGCECREVGSCSSVASCDGWMRRREGVGHPWPLPLPPPPPPPAAAATSRGSGGRRFWHFAKMWPTAASRRRQQQQHQQQQQQGNNLPTYLPTYLSAY